MNVICSICSDSLVQSDDIFYTRCGHVFHFQCLTQWLERSKSCPQCREKVSQSRIHRLYFTFAQNEIVEPQASSLQERIDSLKFQILLKEKDIKHFTSKCIEFEKQNAGLRKEVRRVESEINQKNSAIHALKEQTKYFKAQSLQCDNLKREIDQLKNKIEDLKPIQMLLHAPASDVSRMVGNTRDPQVLMTYISVMKKELSASFNKCKQLRMTIKRLQEEHDKLSTKCDFLLEEQSKRMDLEEKLAFSESKSMSLQNRVDELEEILNIKENCDNESEVEKTEINNDDSERSPVENTSKKGKNNQESSFKTPTPIKRRREVSERGTQNTEDKIPSFQIDDSTDSEIDSVNCSSSSDSSIVFKKSRMSINCSIVKKESNNSRLSNYSIPKKKNVKKKVPQNENKRDGHVIDLT